MKINILHGIFLLLLGASYAADESLRGIVSSQLLLFPYGVSKT
jgi:hypothetical protein